MNGFPEPQAYDSPSSAVIQSEEHRFKVMVERHMKQVIVGSVIMIS